MLYCPYTNTSPPACFINKVEEIRGDVVELIKYALETKKRSCIHWGIDDWGGCWGGVSLYIVATIPKKLIESSK